MVIHICLLCSPLLSSLILTIVVNSGEIIIKADFNPYTRHRKKLYEYVNMTVTCHTQGPLFYYCQNLRIYDNMIEVAWCSCVRYTIMNFLATCCVSLSDYMIDVIITPFTVFKITYSRTSQKAYCISDILCPKSWNNLHSDLQCRQSIYRFKTL